MSHEADTLDALQIPPSARLTDDERALANLERIRPGDTAEQLAADLGITAPEIFSVRKSIRTKLARCVNSLMPR